MALDFIDWICVNEMMENKSTYPASVGFYLMGIVHFWPKAVISIFHAQMSVNMEVTD